MVLVLFELLHVVKHKYGHTRKRYLWSDRVLTSKMLDKDVWDWRLWHDNSVSYDLAAWLRRGIYV
jgi:hypothetical protein